jgi:hypothetical protein
MTVAINLDLELGSLARYLIHTHIRCGVHALDNLTHARLCKESKSAVIFSQAYGLVLIEICEPHGDI